MIANYHTHTWRCNHAFGTEKSYVESAVASGMKILGFSDHSPQYFPGDYYSRFRMTPDRLDGYIQTVLDLRDTYRDRVEIHLGLEVEYYPYSLPKLLSVLQETPMEYAILGQHYLGNEVNDHYAGTPNTDEHLLSRYCRQSAEAMNTGLFTYFAHPDLMNYEGDDKTYRTHMGWLCREANACGMPLEMNLLGLREGRHYPNRRFWEIAAEEGCSVIMGCDAHRPEELNSPEIEEKGRAFLAEFGLTPMDTVPLRPLH